MSPHLSGGECLGLAGYRFQGKSNSVHNCRRIDAVQCKQVKKKGRKAEPETVTADSAVKKQEEFEAMKKKTRNMLLGLVAVIVAAAAGIAAYKAMH